MATVDLCDNKTTVTVKIKQNASTGLSSAYKDRKFSDLIIVNNDKEYHVHKIILSSFIPYFDKMLSSGLAESKSSRIELKHPTKIFDLIIDWAYCQPINVTKENALGLFHLSDYLDIPDLANESLSFLFDHFSNEVVVEIDHWINQIATLKARQLIDQYICENFCDIITTKSFLGYEVDTVHYMINLNELNINSEVQVFEAIIRWITINAKERLVHLPKLILALDWSSIDINQFTNTIAQNFYIKLCKETRPIILSAFESICYNSSDQIKDVNLIIGPRLKDPPMLRYLIQEPEGTLTLKNLQNESISLPFVCDVNMTFNRCTDEYLAEYLIDSDKLILINWISKTYRLTNHSVFSKLFGRNFEFKEDGNVFLWKGNRPIALKPFPGEVTRIHSVAPYKGQFYVVGSNDPRIVVMKLDPCDNVWTGVANAGQLFGLSFGHVNQLKHVLYDNKLILFLDNSNYHIYNLESTKWTQHVGSGLWNRTADLHFTLHQSKLFLLSQVQAELYEFDSIEDTFKVVKGKPIKGTNFVGLISTEMEAKLKEFVLNFRLLDSKTLRKVLIRT
ncbi:kelch-like protein 6 [Tetranychus urticae]|uniref:BTB domain-containing protein n=1 Tax=Tetranychus urticae TaxID=32264 RepID=T1KW81_TETUR|nr:kelch-like protein 6 [Tetranychus urticae]